MLSGAVGCVLGKCVRQWTSPALRSTSTTTLMCNFDAALWGTCYSASAVAIGLQVLVWWSSDLWLKLFYLNVEYLFIFFLAYLGGA